MGGAIVERMIGVISTVLPVFIALALGMLCRKIKLVSPEGVANMRSIAVNLTLPAVVLNAFATAEYTRNSIIIPAVMFGICCAGLALGALLSKLFRLSGKLTPYLFTGFEAGMLGYALFALLYRGEGLSNFAIVDLGQALFVFTVYKALLAGRGSAKTLLKEAFCSTTLWAIALGIIIGASGLYKWMETNGSAEVLNACTDFISAPTGMIILISIGYELVLKDIRWGKTAAVIAVRCGLMGLLLAAVLLLDKFVLGGIIHTGALLMMFILPAPYVLPVFAAEEGERATVSSTLSAMTAFSLILFAVLCAFV